MFRRVNATYGARCHVFNCFFFLILIKTGRYARKKEYVQCVMRFIGKSIGWMKIIIIKKKKKLQTIITKNTEYEKIL